MRYNIPPSKIKKWVEANFEFKTRKNGTEYLICNPLVDTKEKRFNINIETGGCWDWNVGDKWAGDPNPKTKKRPCHIVRFVQLYRGVSFRDALKELVGENSLIYAYEDSKPKEVPKDDPETVQIAIPRGFKPLEGPTNMLATPAWNYLIRRGYTQEEILEQNIHYRGSDILWLYTEFGELVYMQSRNIYTKKFWFPSTTVKDNDGNILGELDITRNDVLYGFDEIPRAEYLILTESIFDKNILGKHALSTGGAILTDGQIKRVKLVGPRQGVVLAPDNDKAAIESILANGVKFSNLGYQVFFSIPPKIQLQGDKYTKDWNEMYTELKLTKREIVETMNKRLVKFDDTSRLRLRQMLAHDKGSKNANKSSFLSGGSVDKKRNK